MWLTRQHGAPVLSTTSSTLSSAPTEASLFRDVAESLAQYSPEHENDKTRLVLETFLSQLPQEGSDNLRHDIKDCNSDEDLRGLANNLIFHILAPLKAKSRTPSIEPSPRLGWQASVESVAAEISSSQREQSWLRKTCLIRDQNRCAITGYYDLEQLKRLPRDHPIRVSGNRTRTQAAHIVPFCCGSFEDAEDSNFSQIQSSANLTVNKLPKASATWDALWRAFPLMRSQAQFGPEQINAPYNALTLASTIHTEFGTFSLALESAGTPGVYHVRQYGELPTEVTSMLPESGTVTLRDTPEIPAPHPVLLEAHAAVARILHMTAMGEQIENVMRDREEVHCLASDGSTDLGYLLMVV